jgi:hypothetical protein
MFIFNATYSEKLHQNGHLGIIGKKKKSFSYINVLHLTRGGNGFLELSRCSRSVGKPWGITKRILKENYYNVG